MGSLWAVVMTLAAGGKVFGLTLGQFEALAALANAEGPAVEKLIADATPLIQKAIKTLAENAGKPPTTIPGYLPDGSVGQIHNPDAR